MASVPGYGIFGSEAYHDELRKRPPRGRKRVGPRQLGTKAYKTPTLTMGWLPVEANWPLGGRVDSHDVTDDYRLTF